MPPGGGYPPPAPGPGGYGMPPQRTTSGAAVASLIFGILGCVPFITGLLAHHSRHRRHQKDRRPALTPAGPGDRGAAPGAAQHRAAGRLARAARLRRRSSRSAGARERPIGSLVDLSRRQSSTAGAGPGATGQFQARRVGGRRGEVKPWGVAPGTHHAHVAVMAEPGQEASKVAGDAMFPNATGGGVSPRASTG
jgi:hypothetical protein